MELEQITLKNIKNFIQGHARVYLDKIKLLPQYTREQVFYRIWICRDTCIPSGKCQICTCSAIKKSYATASCNLSKFPDLMSESEWDLFKLKNNIDSKALSTILEEVDKIFSKNL